MSTKFPEAFVQLLKKNRKRSVPFVAVGVALLLILCGSLYFQKRDGSEKQQKAAPKSVELKIGQDAKGGKGGDKSTQHAQFLLHPLPDELLQQLASMQNLNENVADAKFVGLRVLWPVYYFDNQDAGGGRTTLLLDVSEDGFGILVESDVELSAYPAINALKTGQKMWIGGEILSVDPSGTGTIYLKTEHLQFSDEQPFQSGEPQAK